MRTRAVSGMLQGEVLHRRPGLPRPPHPRQDQAREGGHVLRPAGEAEAGGAAAEGRKACGRTTATRATETHHSWTPGSGSGPSLSAATECTDGGCTTVHGGEGRRSVCEDE